ncbi:MAG TPA: hypothetical protein ENK18_27505 [Deltaproteobacteria bacterium]|nr:hypothetical protein [Deltaproteobacteria bacterium]
MRPDLLVEKARLLLIRERELRELRKQRGAERDWMLRIWKITHSLSTASTLEEGCQRLSWELVQHSPFEFALAGTELAGAELAPTDIEVLHTFAHSLGSEVEARLDHPSLPYLIGGCIPARPSKIVVVVGRTSRTAGFYSDFLDNDSDHLSHLLETCAHILSAVHLREQLTVERNSLRRKVSAQTQQLRSALNEARRARYLAEAANQAKSQFLANTSHELRTPLNAIIGYAQLLLETAQDNEDEAMLHDLQRIESSGTHLLGLISDILDLTKLEAGQLELEHVPVDMDALFKEVIEGAGPLCTRRGNQLWVRHEELGTAWGDPARIQQVLMSLLSNAAKFTEEGEVRLSARSDADQIYLQIADTGIGMTSEQLEHVFDLFRQADSSSTRRYGGSGLGLTITRSLVELMQGSLRVHSEPGEGTTFEIALPRRAREPATSQSDPAPALA